MMLLPWWSKYIAIAALVAAVWLHGFVKGSNRVERAWDAQRTSDERTYFAGVKRAAKVNDKVIYQYIDRYRTVVEQGKTIVREVPKYVTIETNNRCTVPNSFVWLHNAATGQAALPATTERADDPAPNIDLVKIATTVGENYTTCNAVREQLIALQAWASSLNER